MQEQQKLSEEELILKARDLILAMMKSASTDKIQPKDWWSRAKSALETASAVSETPGQMVSKMSQKLEIERLKQESASLVCSIFDSIHKDQFGEFASICESQSIFIAAMAQIERAEQREKGEFINE